ncbi:hypothetical protein [Paraburkholderia fungorum]|uniref:hypothetical protein n=1 Tax=Paraburkholderia fungorum TaxID=134537 RepID=UPI0038B85B40
MSKHLSFPAAMFSVECQRCGNRMQRDERSCSQCGAFRAIAPDAAHDGEIDHEPAPLTVVEGPWPVRHAPDAAAPDEDGRYFRQPPAPVPLLKRTLSVKTTILVACVVAGMACGLTYLLYSMPHRSVDSSEELTPVSRAEPGANTDAGADVSYMNPKALREIDAQLGDTTSTSAPAPAPALVPAQAPPAIDDQALTDEAPPAPPPQVPDNPVARAPAEAEPTTMTTGTIQKAPQDTPATQASGRISPQQPTSNPAFPDARDPNALERAIREYGWKTPTMEKSSP